MKISDLELAQYLNAKFCHELSGSIGAIDNGIEFLSLDNGSMRNKALDLISVSIKQTIKKLLFYRQAYGIAKGEGAADLGEVKELINSFIKDSKVTLKFEPKYVLNASVSQNHAKLIYNLFVAANSNLIHGGIIEIIINQNSEYNEVIVTASGPGLKIDPERENIIKGLLEGITISTANVQYYYIHRILDLLNKKIEIVKTHNNVKYIARG